MANKPLILDAVVGRVKQNPSNTELDIPLTDRVDALEQQMITLVTFLEMQGFELPEELTDL